MNAPLINPATVRAAFCMPLAVTAACSIYSGAAFVIIIVCGIAIGAACGVAFGLGLPHAVDIYYDYYHARLPVRLAAYGFILLMIGAAFTLGIYLTFFLSLLYR